MEHEMDVYKPDDRKDKSFQKKAIKKNAIKFTKIVSLVGVRHATDSRNSSTRRIVWVAWLLFGIVVAFYQTEQCLERFFTYPVLTEMKIVTGKERIQFPQVTICCDNQIMASKAREKGVFKDIAYIENTLQRIRVYEERPYYKNASYLRDIARVQLDEHIRNLDNLTVTRQWDVLSKDLAPTVNETIAKATFNNDQSFSRSQAEDVVTDLGHCHAFGTKAFELFTTKQGPLNGLNLILHSKSLEIIPSVRFLANYDSLPGFKVLIHDPTEVPRMRDAGFSVKRGKIVRVTLSYESLTQMEYPHGSCNGSDKDYRRSRCNALCEYRQYVAKCGCKDIHMNLTELENERFCSYSEILNCTRFLSSRDAPSASTGETDCNCTQQCHRKEYKTEITQSKMSTVIDDATRTNVNEGTTDDMMMLEIYYPLMSYFEASDVEAYSVSKLLCDIGNALSLLLGATLLTIYESIEFVFLFLADYAKLRFYK